MSSLLIYYVSPLKCYRNKLEQVYAKVDTHTKKDTQVECLIMRSEK